LAEFLPVAPGRVVPETDAKDRYRRLLKNSRHRRDCAETLARWIFTDAVQRCAYCQERRRKVLKAANGARICKPCATVACTKPGEGYVEADDDPSCRWCGATESEWFFFPKGEKTPSCCAACCRKAAAL